MPPHRNYRTYSCVYKWNLRNAGPYRAARATQDGMSSLESLRPFWPLAKSTSLMPDLAIEIVKRCDRVKGFVVEPQRWIVERSIGWLNRCRRLAKDWENRNHNALAFLRLASIRLMLRKLCNPS